MYANVDAIAVVGAIEDKMLLQIERHGRTNLLLASRSTSALVKSLCPSLRASDGCCGKVETAEKAALEVLSRWEAVEMVMDRFPVSLLCDEACKRGRQVVGKVC